MKQVHGLGLDAGGTQTRWALADGHGAIVAEGQVAPLHPARAGDPEGRSAWQRTLRHLAQQLTATGQAWPLAVHAGMTGYGGQDADIRPLLQAALGLRSENISLGNDVELAYRDAFDPGAGHLVYAGTGSIAIHIDAKGQLHRAGGHGSVLDDAGGGHWIGREALRGVWRREDEEPGAWQRSPMATALLQRMGGPDWSHTRAFLAQADRGAMGLLATAVAHAADEDPAARAILEGAGLELARLARILLRRLGTKPVALAGRVWSLHPVIALACRSALPAEVDATVRACCGHHAAARLALGRIAG